VKLGGSKPLRRGQLGRQPVAVGEQHEREVEAGFARALKVKRQPGSGNKPGSKADLKGTEPGSFLVEAKATTKKTLEVESAWVRRICDQARDAGRKPLLVLSFQNHEGPFAKKWACLPFELFLDMIAAAGIEWDHVEQ
jgi:Holliday junction resolvase